MFNFFYGLSLHLAAAAAAPFFLYQMLYKGKYRSSYKERFGLSTPRIVKNKDRLVWIHAVSVGEAKAVAPLSKKIKEADPGVQLVVTTGTETGQQAAKNMMPFADAFHYLPPDFAWLMRRMMQRARPDLVIISETDYWYNFFRYAKNAGAKIIVVNAKLSNRSLNQFRKYRFYSKKIFSFVDFFCVQNKAHFDRFQDLSVPQSRMSVTSNFKFDNDHPHMSFNERSLLHKTLGLGEGPVLVIGSTHKPEEKMLLDEISKVWKTHPELKVLFVPRHPERFDEVAGLFMDKGLRFSRYSAGAADKMSQVVLIDAMGLLLKCYQLADIAIVGGSYTEKIGGHNVLEPCSYGVPVVYGPHMLSQAEMDRLVRQYKAGLQVPINRVAAALENLIRSAQTRKMLGNAGLKLVREQRGAVEKGWEIIRKNYFPCK